jgi:hypothetical protein
MCEFIENAPQAFLVMKKFLNQTFLLTWSENQIQKFLNFIFAIV